MASRLYNPFLDFKFDNSRCFLSGEPLQSADEQIQVFPLWMMRMFDLEEKPFKMLDENIVTYKSLKLPCASHVASFFEQLETQVEQAMMKGYDAVSQLPEINLFDGVGTILCGVIFNKIHAEISPAFITGEAMNFSQALVPIFRNLHHMLHAIYLPMAFDYKNP